MSKQQSEARICACVLAAGKSSRFGASKLVQPFRGLPLVQHALKAAQGACRGQVHLVVGHQQSSVVEASSGCFDTIIVNSHFENGIGSSISAAASACQKFDAVLILLADQPLISTEHLSNLMASWSGADDEIVASAFGEVTGPPILFPRTAFADLIELTGDTGAKSLLDSAKFSVRSIDFPPAAMDVDTPEDLRRLDQG